MTVMKDQVCLDIGAVPAMAWLFPVSAIILPEGQVVTHSRLREGGARSVIYIPVFWEGQSDTLMGKRWKGAQVAARQCERDSCQ